MNDFIKNMLTLGAELDKATDPMVCSMIINDAEILYRNEQKALNIDLVSKPLHISDFHIGFEYLQYEMDRERYLNKGMIWVKKEYGFNSPRLHKIKELIDNGELHHCNVC